MVSVPLSPAATAAADDQFYANHPEMIDENGQRIPLSPTDPAHAEMRAEWVDLYEAENGGGGGEAPPEVADPPGEDDAEETPDPGGETPVEIPCEPCPGEDEDPFEEVPTVKVRISVFIDGTGNNRANDPNSESNVSKMQNHCARTHPGYDHYAAIYIEGIGTLDGWWDDPIESGTGWGIGGIGGKTAKGIRRLIETVNGFGIVDPIVEFHIDACGFSRGAAAVRYFIWRMMRQAGSTLTERITGEGYEMWCDVEAKFLGLYDTVASYGFDHENDTEQLHLDDIYMCETVVQVAAAEEHRKNFRLTTISSGETIYMPGVHSDIGGGYEDNSRETGMDIFDLGHISDPTTIPPEYNTDAQWWYSRGWYNEGEITYHPLGAKLTGTRGPISQEYNRIPLQAMVARAGPQGGLPFLASMHQGPNVVSHSFLRSIAGSLEASSASTWMNSKSDWHKRLRHGWLHNSSNYDSLVGAHVPNWANGYRVRGTNAG